MAANDEIKRVIKKYIIDNFLFGNETEEIKEEDSFMERGIIDSTGILELIEFVEETYGFAIEDDELIPENLDSLNNLAWFILSKKSKSITAR